MYVSYMGRYTSITMYPTLPYGTKEEYLWELEGKVAFYMVTAEKISTKKFRYLMHFLSTNFIGSLGQPCCLF